MNARYYDGGRGQFLGQDPVFNSTKQNLLDPQTLNSYSYASNNPINKKDPTGLATVKGSIKEIQKNLISVLNSYVGFLQSAASNPKGTAKAVGGSVKSTAKSVGNAVSNPVSTAKSAYSYTSQTVNRFRNGTDAEQDAMIGKGLVGVGALVLTKKVGGVVIEGTEFNATKNGKGILIRPAGTTGNANTARIMSPTERYPNGYIVIYNSEGQPVNLDGKPDSRANTHLDFTKDDELN